MQAIDLVIAALPERTTGLISAGYLRQTASFALDSGQFQRTLSGVVTIACCVPVAQLDRASGYGPEG
jgi:hypothetical protein